MSTDPRRRSGVLLRACPQCGQTRLRRVAGAAVPADAPRSRYGRVTRMRCAAEGCGFEGWVPRRLRRRTGRRSWSMAARRGWKLVRNASPLLAALALAAVAATGGAAWERQQLPTRVLEQRNALPAGEYHDGDPLPPTHPLAQARQQRPEASPLDLRASCVWGRPGRDPYRGSVGEALAAAQVPAAVRAELLARRAEGRKAGRLRIGNDGIVEIDGGRRFAPQGFAMTHGRTLCLDTRVNFLPGHTEAADLYEATDPTGRRWSMMVPDVCGNVSIIAPARQHLPRELTLRGPGRPGTATADEDPGDRVHPIPEPGTLACVLAAAGAWWAARVRRRR